MTSELLYQKNLGKAIILALLKAYADQLGLEVKDIIFAE